MEARVPALRIEGLTTGLSGPVSFDIAAGVCVALMGPSGAGKSLLLRALVDLDASTGNVRIGDRMRCDMPASEWRKLVALVPADSGWWADRVVDYFPSNSDAIASIAALGLADSLDWEVIRLSTGERQRLRNRQSFILGPAIASPEVGAVCGIAACMALCGGRGVTRVPTATS
jgi:ABC-type multidrug transport system ATPase subunit